MGQGQGILIEVVAYCQFLVVDVKQLRTGNDRTEKLT